MGRSELNLFMSEAILLQLIKRKIISKILGNIPNIHNEKSCLIAHFLFQLCYAYFKQYARKLTDQMNEHQNEDFWIRDK